MAHRQLLDRHAKRGCLGEDFGVNHRACRVDLDTVEDMALECFESAVNVADLGPEDAPHEDIPTPGKQKPVRRVMSPSSVTSNDVVGIRLFYERSHFPQVELPIGVGEENYIIPRLLDAAFERGTVASVRRMMNNTYVGKLQGQIIANLTCSVFATVVHHNDLKNWSKFRYDPTHVLNDAQDICLIVKFRKNDRQRFSDD